MNFRLPENNSLAGLNKYFFILNNLITFTAPYPTREAVFQVA